MAAAEPTGTFSCAFTRRNCSHDVVFHHEYQRTNRTKENKILRCFPHCCPDHVVRSYCGSSLHLQVDFHDGTLPSSSSSPPLPPPPSHLRYFPQPRRDDDLMVFGRFRPKDSRGFAIGDAIAGETILSSLQSEDNPAGEWIEAWLIASADRNAWLFEVNHAARWYYNWGSSAAKDKRLKEHVFEVYVLYQPSVGPSESFEVAAVSCSPPFKLVSFRRAPVESRLRGHETIEETQSNETKKPASLDEIDPVAAQRRLSPIEWEEKESRPAHLVSLTRSRPTSPPLTAAADYRQSVTTTQRAFGRMALPEQALEHRHHYRHANASTGSYSRRSSSSPLTSSPHKRARMAMSASPSRRGLSIPTGRSSARVEPHETRTASPATRSRLKELLLIADFLRRLPLTTALLMVPSLDAAFQQHAAAAEAAVSTRVSTRVSVSSLSPFARQQSSHTLQSSSDTARHVEKLLLELSDARPLPYLSPSFVEAAAHLALWLAFDTSVRQSLESLYAQAAAVLLTKASLLEVHAQLVRWLHAQIERQLQQRQWTMDAFVAAVERSGLVAAATQSASTHSAGHSTQSAGQGTSVAFEDFVAQARERFISRQPTRLVSRAFSAEDRYHQHNHHRYQQWQQQQQHRYHHHHHISSDGSLLDGSWRCDVGRIHVRACGNRHDTGLSPVPLQALLWFWRQLSCVDVALSSQHELSPLTPPLTPTLTVKSAFASHEAVGLRLVLDGRARWFRSFPGGESTSAVAVGTQRFGDYHALRTPQTDGVECVMYSWPVGESAAEAEESAASAAVAMCWRWLLQPLRTSSARASRPLLRVQLVLETGSVSKGSELVETASLGDKCARVAQWQRALVADWVSERA